MSLGVDGVEELDGDGDFLAGLGRVEEDDGFEVIAEGDAAAVEVEDLGHGAVGVGVELEPDAGAGEVVAVEGVGDGVDLAEPDGILGGLAGNFLCLPGGVVEGDGFAVGDVACVRLPGAVREIAEESEAGDDVLGFPGKLAGDAGDFRGDALGFNQSLRLGGAGGECGSEGSEAEGRKCGRKTFEGGCHVIPFPGEMVNAGTEGTREQGNDRTRERGNEGTRERGNEGTRERGNEGGRDRGKEG